MSVDALVKVERVSKKFCRSLKRGLWYGVQDVSAEMFGRKGNYEELRKNEFWAVNDVSFELKRGQCLGLIGPNGAGKSTLLKMLNGLVKPDLGRITMRGRVGALIELGAGFNPILTARENIYVNGSVLGLRKKEIDQKFDAIVDFAEIEEFIDTPVQNFSSGMKVRLGFAVAAQMEPDVLIIDEVLAVGDVGFRAKCFNAIRKLSSNAAVILVTHQMPEVARSCNSAILMVHGKVAANSAEVTSVIQQYHSHFHFSDKYVVNGKDAQFLNIEVFNQNHEKCQTINHLDSLFIEFEFIVNKEIKHPELSVMIADQSLNNIIHCHSYFDKVLITNNGKAMRVRLQLQNVNLNPGTYVLSAGIYGYSLGEVLVKWMEFKKIQVNADFIGFAPVVAEGTWEVLS